MGELLLEVKRQAGRVAGCGGGACPVGGVDFGRRLETAGADLTIQLGEPEPLGQVHLRLADLAPLGADDHHAVRRPSAVDGRGRGALQNLDRLNVFGVDVGDAVDLRVLVGRRVAARCRLGHGVLIGRNRDIAHHDPVHDVERRGGRVDRGRAAEPHLQAATGGSRLLWISAPATLPTSCCSTLRDGRDVHFVAVDHVATEVARFFRSIPVA